MMRSIGRRLAASYALIVLASVTLMGGLALAFVSRYVVRQEREFLSANATAVARQALLYIGPPVRHRALQELASASAFLGNARVRVLGADREVLADSGDPAAPDQFLWLVPSVLSEIEGDHGTPAPFIFPLPPERQTDELRDLAPFLRDLPLGMSRQYIERQVTPWGRRFSFEPTPAAPQSQPVSPRAVLTVTVPVGDIDRVAGWVELSSPLSFQRQTMAAMAPALGLAGIGALALAIALGLLMGRTLSDPLRHLAHAARRMAGGDLSVRAPAGRRDEIGEVAEQFNAMAATLERSFHDLAAERDSLRRFVADASHELRTPVTALATFMELLEGPAADDEAARREFVRESRQQIERLAWIVENLLDLSRLDAGIVALSLGRHDAGDLLAAASAPHFASAAHRGVRLEIRRPDPPIAFSCDRQRVELALSNLVSNAVKFARDGGTVEAWAELLPAPTPAGRSGGVVRLVVRDDGAGIDAEDLPRIFERFYRGRNAPPEGAGLGLAIVHSVAVAHGGSVRVESEPGTGSTFYLELPVETHQPAGALH